MSAYKKFKVYVEIIVSVVFVYKLSCSLVDCRIIIVILISYLPVLVFYSLHRNHQDGKEDGQMTHQKRKRKGKWTSVVTSN